MAAIPWRTKLLFIVIVAVSAALRLHLLDQALIFFDEAFSWSLTTQFSFAEMIERTGRDVHPPAYYVVLRGWIALFGDSLFAMRGMSVLFGVGTAILAFFLCRDLFHGCQSDKSQPSEKGESVGLLASALVGVSTSHVCWSQQARMYTVGTFLIVLTTWLIWRGLLQRRSFQYWVLVGCLDSLVALTHNFCLFSIAAQAGYVGGLWLIRSTSTGDGRPLSLEPRKWLAAGCTFAGLYSLWVPTLLRQVRDVRQDYWISSLSGRSISEAVFEVLIPQIENPGVPALTALIMIVVAVFARLIAVPLRAHYAVLALAAFPLILAVDFSLFVTIVLAPRFLLFSLPFLYVGIAQVISTLPPSPRRFVFSAVLVLSAFGDLGRYQNLSYTMHDQMDRLVAHIAQRFHDDDILIVTDPMQYFDLRYYFRRSPVAKRMLLLPALPVTNWQGGPLLTAGDTSDLLQHEAFASRLWFVTDDHDTGHDGRRWKKTHHVVGREAFGKLCIVSYDPDE